MCHSSSGLRLPFSLINVILKWTRLKFHVKRLLRGLDHLVVLFGPLHIFNSTYFFQQPTFILLI